jgi:hypothetical protein
MRLDLAIRAAGEPPGKGEPKPCTATVACAQVAPNARLEDPLALVGSYAGSVVIDRVANPAVSPFDRNEDRARGVTTRVVEERLQDALPQIGVDRDADGGLWRVEIELDAALGSEVGARCRGSGCDGVGVSSPMLDSGLVTRGCK